MAWVADLVAITFFERSKMAFVSSLYNSDGYL